MATLFNPDAVPNRRENHIDNVLADNRDNAPCPNNRNKKKAANSIGKLRTHAIKKQAPPNANATTNSDRRKPNRSIALPAGVKHKEANNVPAI